MTNGTKTFLPFHQIKNENVIVVDGLHPRAFALSHWKGANKHSELAADTSGEIALNAIERKVEQINYPFVSATHFDIDGFVGVFALFYPDLALENKELLKQMAIIGDFREYNPLSEAADTALKLCCWMNKVEMEQFYRPFEEKDEMRECVPKFHFFLEKFPAVLKNPDLFKEDWEEEYTRVKTDLLLIEEKTFEKDLGLLLLKVKSPIHYYSLFSGSEGADIVVSIYPKNRYELEYKYTTWIDLTGRKSLARIDLKPLVSLLNEKEGSGFYWKADPITDTGPILRLEKDKLSKAERYAHPFERKIYSSSILEKEFINEILAFFKEAYKGVEAKRFWTWEEMRELNKIAERK